MVHDRELPRYTRVLVAVEDSGAAVGSEYGGGQVVGP
jgi:hypothetical protein